PVGGPRPAAACPQGHRPARRHERTAGPHSLAQRLDECPVSCVLLEVVLLGLLVPQLLVATDQDEELCHVVRPIASGPGRPTQPSVDRTAQRSTNAYPDVVRVTVAPPGRWRCHERAR